MAPPRRIPDIETNAGFKTTTVRLSNAQFDEVDLFCGAMNLSLTEFVRDALDSYVTQIAKDPTVRKAVQRRITRVTRLMDKIAARSDGRGRVVRDEDDEEESDIEEVEIEE